jgi:histidinol-phosphate aminotransferase
VRVAVPRLRPTLGQVPRYVAGTPPTGASALPPYKLASNENPYPPLPGVLEAIAAAAARTNRYPDPTGRALTERIAERLAVPTEHVVLGTGSVGLLHQVVQIAAGEGEEVVFAWRSFESYPIVTTINGSTPVPVPLRADQTHDLDAMAAAVTDRTRVVFVCTPNNPTGTAVRRAELDRFLDQVPDDVLVVVDEAYTEFVRGEEWVDGIVAYRERPNVAVLRTFSKAYGLAGLRVGFAVAHPEVAHALRLTSVPFGVSTIAQEAALASLDAEEALLERVARLVDERTRVETALDELGLGLARSQANFVWLPGPTAALVEACDAVNLSVRAYGDDGARVTIGETEANDRFLEVMSALVRAARR